MKVFLSELQQYWEELYRESADIYHLGKLTYRRDSEGNLLEDSVKLHSSLEDFMVSIRMSLPVLFADRDGVYLRLQNCTVKVINKTNYYTFREEVAHEHSIR